jgi:chromate transporter
MVLQFVGFLAALREPGMLHPLMAASLGGLLATWVTFAPCFLWIFAGAPYVETLRANKALSGALTAITAAVVGVILNLAVWFAQHVLFREQKSYAAFGMEIDYPVLASVDLYALALAALAAIMMFVIRVGLVKTLIACSAAGVALRLAGLLG